jgi:hypothetical protein
MRHLPLISFILMVLVAIGWQFELNRSYEQGRQVAVARKNAVFPVIPVPAPAASPPPVVSSPPETEKRLGPFSINGNNYVVVLRQEPQSRGGQTVSAMEIRDSRDTLLYKRSFRSQPDRVSHSESWYVSAHLMTRGNGTGLMVNYSRDGEPSAHEETTWWQLFGVVDGVLRPFTGPLAVQGDLLDSHFDNFDFRVWAHYASLIFPVRVDWAEGKMLPEQNCETIPCQFKVIPKEPGYRGDLTFVRLCPDPEKCQSPERVLVKNDSNIEIASCSALVRWNPGNVLDQSSEGKSAMDGEAGITVPGDAVWLKMRIDGKEGWVHDEEDFMRIGMIFEH